VTGPLGPCQAKQPTVMPRVWVQCGAPGTVQLRYRCAHGHERTGTTCEAHRPGPGQVGCAACWDAGREVQMEVVPS
jgi:hypothetical protein